MYEATKSGLVEASEGIPTLRLFEWPNAQVLSILEPYLERLCRDLKTTEPRLRARAIRRACSLGADARSLTDDVLGALTDERFFVRAEAVRALEAIAPDDPTVRQALERPQNDPNQEVREAVQRVLNKSGSDQ